MSTVAPQLLFSAGDALAPEGAEADPRANTGVLGRDPVLELSGISLSFKGVRALSAVGLQVAPGEICGLIGPNGAGKSSRLNVMRGVYRPTTLTSRAAALKPCAERASRSSTAALASTKRAS